MDEMGADGMGMGAQGLHYMTSLKFGGSIKKPMN
jgi:hypothetical protein